MLTVADRYRALASKCRLAVALDMNTALDPEASAAMADALDHLAELSVDVDAPMRAALSVLFASPAPPTIA